MSQHPEPKGKIALRDDRERARAAALGLGPNPSLDDIVAAAINARADAEEERADAAEARVNAAEERARDAERAFRTAQGELVRTARSLAFLRARFAELADEFGLAEEDTAGIVRAAKSREGAAQVVAEQKKILERIGKLAGQRSGETVEAAVERALAFALAPGGR